jgi:hypothetical protein
MFSDIIPQLSGPERVQGAIRRAAASTGTSFDYLLATAKRESALDPDARAQSSSATGLFQFIDSTWLQTLKEEGPAYGLAVAAAAIERSSDGRYLVRDPGARQAILALREDPELNAMMAGAFTRKNRAGLKDALGREPTSGELYLAHFMGLGGAAKLIGLAASDGTADAALAFPRQAAANRAVFYDKGGSGRSASEVYANLVTPFEMALPTGGASVKTASTEQKVPADPAAWLAIPIHNAYAIEAAGPFGNLFRSTASSPLSDHVVGTWARIETRRSGSDAHATEKSAVPKAPKPTPQERQTATPPAGPPADASPEEGTSVTSPFASLFASLFASSWAAPVRTGKNWGG